MGESTEPAIKRLRREKANLLAQIDYMCGEIAALTEQPKASPADSVDSVRALRMMADSYYRLRDDVRRHLDRLEAAVGDPHGLDVGAIADAVACLRRAVDGGPDGDPDA